MREQERRLLRCIGGIDDELILEAEALRFKSRLWGNLLALAACAALVIAIPAALRGLETGQADPGQVTGQPAVPDRETVQAPADPGSEAAEGGMEDLWDGIPAEPNYADAEILREASIGGLYLGMPESEVEALLGQPWNDWAESQPGNDDFNRVTWRYDTGEPNQHSDYDLDLEFIDLGRGWILNKIHVGTGCALPLSSGVAIGSTVEEVQNSISGGGGVTTYKKVDTANGDTYSYYAVGPDWSPGNSSWSGLLFEFYNGEVTFITFGPWVIDAEPPEPYDLTSNEITIYQWIDQRWHTTTVIDKAAKYICTVLTISEPEEASGEKTGMSSWMDFGNGTLVELLGGDRASVWTREATDEPFDPSKTDGLTWQIGGVFTGLDDYVAQALEDPTATWDRKFPDIYEGGPESAPEAEAEP